MIVPKHWNLKQIECKWCHSKIAISENLITDKKLLYDILCKDDDSEIVKGY